ncbi:MAG: prepilin peptidase [Comamonas sp.]|jgi:prepilin peptidase CpaA|uniref:A24 family peptidase n=1 Tax=Comamonas sp. TaxID=34028 RepID=UPI002829A088|nr:prepilin peptidase [Comamonas sp.]MDR0216229.1 prepilin peptidase [Comamonas sp.]
MKMGLIFLLWIVGAGVCDLLYRKCFNWFVILGGIMALISLCIYPELHPVSIKIIDGVLGGIFTFIVFLIFFIFKMMGAGDVKFGAALGIWVGWKLILPIWALSCLFSVIHGLFSRSTLKYFFVATSSMRDGKEESNRKFIPYVTYMSVATVIVLGLYKNH